MRRIALTLALLATALHYGNAEADAFATGFAISKKYVLTAYDGTEQGKFVSVKFRESEWMAARCIGADKSAGWCVFELSYDAPAYVDLDTERTPEPGDKIYTFGFSANDDSSFDMTFNEGSIVGVMRSGGMVHTIPFSAGTFGAPLFLDDSNKVIGLVLQDRKDEWGNAHCAMSVAPFAKKLAQYVGGAEEGRQVGRIPNKSAICAIKGGTASTEGVVVQGDSIRGGDDAADVSDANTAAYKSCRDSVAVVEGLQGSGTGFLCEMDGKKYLVTNKHVANQRGRIRASFIEGGQILFYPDSPIEIAENRDLVRFEVKTDRPCLALSEGTPEIGEKIEFYGNAVGQKVITMTAGKVLAVGMERIEISSPIQSGNSGSPLVLAKSGEVIGVTTLSVFNKINKDQSKVGTRYDPKVRRTREFAVRFSGVNWKRMSYGAFLRTVNAYKDYCEFHGWMREMCTIDAQEENRASVFDFPPPSLKFAGVGRLNDMMGKIAKCDADWKKQIDRLKMMRERNESGTGRIGSYGAMEFQNAIKTIRDKAWRCYKMRRTVISSAVACAKADDNLSAEERDEVVRAFDEMLREYCEKYRRQLKGFDI